jgi:hypothetical protein
LSFHISILFSLRAPNGITTPIPDNRRSYCILDNHYDHYMRKVAQTSKALINNINPFTDDKATICCTHAYPVLCSLCACKKTRQSKKQIPPTMTVHYEPTAAELAFEKFRLHFPHTNVWVEGDRMIYRYRSEKALIGAKILAELIVARQQLQLTVTTQSDAPSTFPRLLILTYNETRSTNT